MIAHVTPSASAGAVAFDRVVALLTAAFGPSSYHRRGSLEEWIGHWKKDGRPTLSVSRCVSAYRRADDVWLTAESSSHGTEQWTIAGKSFAHFIDATPDEAVTAAIAWLSERGDVMPVRETIVTTPTFDEVCTAATARWGIRRESFCDEHHARWEGDPKAPEPSCVCLQDNGGGGRWISAHAGHDRGVGGDAPTWLIASTRAEAKCVALEKALDDAAAWIAREGGAMPRMST